MENFAESTKILTSLFIISCFLFFHTDIKAQDASSCICCMEEQHAFDFWVGNWEVFNDKGQKVGENRIVRMENACAIQENWKGSGGGSGSSINFYDIELGQWRQLWVNARGGILELYGNRIENQMVMSSLTKENSETIDQITWTLNQDGSVQQVWKKSQDNGKSWNPVFSGLYKKKD